MQASHTHPGSSLSSYLSPHSRCLFLPFTFLSLTPQACLCGLMWSVWDDQAGQWDSEARKYWSGLTGWAVIFCRQGMCQTSMMNMATTEKGRPISYKRPYFSDSQIPPRLKFANLLVGDPFVPGLCFQLQKLTLPIANAATKMLFHGHMCDHRVSQLDAVAYGGPRSTYYI